MYSGLQYTKINFNNSHQSLSPAQVKIATINFHRLLKFPLTAERSEKKMVISEITMSDGYSSKVDTINEKEK